MAGSRMMKVFAEAQAFFKKTERSIGLRLIGKARTPLNAGLSPRSFHGFDNARRKSRWLEPSLKQSGVINASNT